MSLTATEVAERFGGARPGFELISVEEVGLPFFRLNLEVVVQERSALPAVDEFLLRAAAAGLDSVEAVSGVLGLEPILVEQAVVNQSHLDHLDYYFDSVRGQHRLRLTTLGRTALQDTVLVPERTEIDIAFDRLLWIPTGRRIGQLMRPKDAVDFGLQEIPPLYKKRLAASELDTDSVERAIHELPVRALQETDLLALTNVINRRHVLPAVALVYVANDGSTTQVAFAVDGRLSDEHERVFAAMGGPERCGFVVDAAPDEAERPEVPERLMVHALSREEVQALQKRGAELDQDLDDSRTATAALEGERASQPIQEVEGELREDSAELAEQLHASPVRAIQTYEHRELLNSALADTQRRLLVIAPWVRSAVVNATFVARLERLCRNGVAVHIGWGFSEDEEAEQSDPAALEALRGLSGRHKDMEFRFVGDTHAKVLIWDQNLVVTSFNWLSFRGDPKRRYRQEVGVLIRDADYVDEQYGVFREQIQAASSDDLTD